MLGSPYVSISRSPAWQRENRRRFWQYCLGIHERGCCEGCWRVVAPRSALVSECRRNATNAPIGVGEPALGMVSDLSRACWSMTGRSVRAASFGLISSPGGAKSHQPMQQISARACRIPWHQTPSAKYSPSFSRSIDRSLPRRCRPSCRRSIFTMACCCKTLRHRLSLPRHRLDFLLLLPGRQRLVLEVDGKHHFSERSTVVEGLCRHGVARPRVAPRRVRSLPIRCESISRRGRLIEDRRFLREALPTASDSTADYTS